MNNQDNLAHATDAEIMLLATADSEIEGLMWAEAIRDRGIPVLLRPGGPGAGAWASAATFEHVLYVREADLDAAREILDTLLPDDQVVRPRARRQAPTVRRRSLRKSE